MGLTPFEADVYSKKMAANLNHTLQNNLDRKSRQLFSAVRKNRYALAEALLLERVSPNQKNNKGFTLLHTAALYGHPEMVNLLVKHGAQLEATDNDGNTALFHAVYSGVLKVVKTLIDIHNANIEHTDRNKGTILHIACFKQYDDICDYLVNRFITKLDKPDLNGTTPVHLAAAKGNKKLLRLMSSQGFNLEATDHRVPALSFLDYAEICLSEEDFMEFRNDFETLDFVRQETMMYSVEI